MKGIPYTNTFLNKLDWKIYIKQRNWPPVVKITNFEPENEASTKKIKAKIQYFKKFLFLVSKFITVIDWYFLGIHTLDFYISNVLNNTQIKGG